MKRSLSISIIIPVYNVEPYIVRCLQSVMDQTYDGPMECLLVDDCCTDNSFAIVGQMLDRYKGTISFKVLHHERNRGQAAARNTGTMVATGDYIYYLDSDDAMTPDCVALMVEEVEKHPGLEMVIGAYKRYDGERELPQYSYESGLFDDNNKIRWLFFKEGFGFSSVVWNKLIKRSFILSNSLFFKEGVIHEDDHWSFYVYKKLKYLSVIGKCTYLHYVREESTMTTLTKQRTADSVVVILEDLACNLEGKYAVLQLFYCLKEYLYEVFPYVAKKKTKTLHAFFLKKLLHYGYLKIAFCFFVNWIIKWRYYQLSYVMVPEAYRKESEKAMKTLD